MSFHTQAMTLGLGVKYIDLRDRTIAARLTKDTASLSTIKSKQNTTCEERTTLMVGSTEMKETTKEQEWGICIKPTSGPRSGVRGPILMAESEQMRQ